MSSDLVWFIAWMLCQPSKTSNIVCNEHGIQVNPEPMTKTLVINKRRHANILIRLIQYLKTVLKVECASSKNLHI